MACSRPSVEAAGFATPAALLLCLALALICSAIVARSVMTLRLSWAELGRTQQEFALDGAALVAEAAIIRNAGPGPFEWSLTTGGVQTEILAEPEVDKVSPAAAAGLPDAVFAALGVQDLAPLRARLAALAASADRPTIASLDAAPLWAACGPSAISVFGQRDHVIFLPRSAPTAAADQPAWHIGEAWRVRITTSAGWRDDRIVRFTGSPQHPAAVVSRAFARVGDRGGECDDLLTAVAGG